jgi:YihY family inner membrane protein
MSTASVVPETWALTGDDAQRTLRRTGRMRLLRDSVARLRAADGFSHARSMAFLLILIFFQAVIAIVGLATAIVGGGISDFIVKLLRSISPGPAGVVLTDAAQQARQAGSSPQHIALILGTVGAIATGTTLLGQIERALNRIYGIERDRPTLHKYGRAFVLAITAGLLAVLAFSGLGLGSAIASSIGGGTASTIWNVIRWPLAIGMLVASTALIFRWSPRRHQPAWSWLAFGSAVSVALVAVVTFVLDRAFTLSSSFGTTYGPLAGIVALAFWAFFSSVMLLYGAAIGAQLEAIRAGAPGPKSVEKARASEPWVGPETFAPVR